MIYTLIMYAVVIGVSIVGRKNPVVLALATWWVAGMVSWHIYGTIPPTYAFVLDLIAFFVVAVLARGMGDILILALFPATFAAHVYLNQWADWFVSWCIGLIQFILAGLCSVQMKWGKVSRDIEKKARVRPPARSREDVQRGMVFFR